MKEVNNAYWVAVNCFETKLVKNAILTVPTMPAEKLSVNTIIERRFKFGSEIAGLGGDEQFLKSEASGKI